jgi:septation ring formation regulator EzrA
MQTQALQDKLDAARAENSNLKGEISQQQQNNYFAGVVAQALAPVNAQLNALGGKVEAIENKMPNTVAVQYPNLVAVNNTPFMGGYGYPYGNGF